MPETPPVSWDVPLSWHCSVTQTILVKGGIGVLCSEQKYVDDDEEDDRVRPIDYKSCSETSARICN